MNSLLGKVVYWKGPEEGTLKCNDTMLVLMSKQSKMIMVQVLSGKLAGMIIYVSKAHISEVSYIDKKDLIL